VAPVSVGVSVGVGGVEPQRLQVVWVVATGPGFFCKSCCGGVGSHSITWVDIEWWQ
jgi:hypothetical protein